MSVSTIKIETDLVTLMKVLDRTGNPTVAIEILNGTYQTPDICMGDKAYFNHRSEYVRAEFVGYDAFSNIVTYSRKDWGTSDIPLQSWNKLQLWSEYIESTMVPVIDEEDL